MKKLKPTLMIQQHGKLMNKTIKKRKNGDFEVVNTSYNIPVQYVYVK
jgi:hypothetical protein